MQSNLHRRAEWAFVLHTLSRVLGRATVFFFLLSLLLLGLYLLGNFQEFLDSTQVFLLEMLKVTLTAEIFLGLCVMVVLFVVRQSLAVLRLALTFLSVVFSYLLLLFLQFLTSWLTL